MTTSMSLSFSFIIFIPKGFLLSTQCTVCHTFRMRKNLILCYLNDCRWGTAILIQLRPYPGCVFSGQKSILMFLFPFLVSSLINRFRPHEILYYVSCFQNEKMSCKDQCCGSVIISSGSGSSMPITVPTGSSSGGCSHFNGHWQKYGVQNWE